MWWLFLEKHSTVHKADDILQLVSFNKKKKKKEQTTGTPQRWRSGVRLQQVWTRPLHCQWEAGKLEDLLWKRERRTGCRDHLKSASMPPWRVEIFAGSWPTCIRVRSGAIFNHGVWIYSIKKFYFQRILYSHDSIEHNPQIFLNFVRL